MFLGMLVVDGWWPAATTAPKGAKSGNPMVRASKRCVAWGIKPPSPLALDEGQQHTPCHITDWSLMFYAQRH